MTVIRPVGTSSRGSIGRSRCDSFWSRTFYRVIARIGTVHFAGGNFGGISAYPGAASLRFTFTCALASPMDERIPPASRFRKSSLFEFSGGAPIGVQETRRFPCLRRRRGGHVGRLWRPP